MFDWNRAALALTSALALVSAAAADIGFGAAATLCRERVPGATLVELKLKQQAGGARYEGELYDAAVTTKSEVTFDRDTGAFIELKTEAVEGDDASEIAWVIERVDDATIDFAGAVEIANASSGRSDAKSVELEGEEGILAFSVEYAGAEVEVYVDAITGGVIPHHEEGDEDVEETVAGAVVIEAIGIAEAEMGKGWVTIATETEHERAASSVEVQLVDLASGDLALVEVSGGAVVSTHVFDPAGSQAARIAEIIANWDLVQTDLVGAIEVAMTEYPGAGVHEAKLRVEDEKSGIEVFWKIELVTAQFVEIDFFVDATVPSGEGFRFATAPNNALVGDLNLDGTVDALDLAELLALWGVANPAIDLDGDGVIAAGDLAVLLANWR